MNFLELDLDEELIVGISNTRKNLLETLDHKRYFHPIYPRLKVFRLSIEFSRELWNFRASQMLLT